PPPPPPPPPKQQQQQQEQKQPEKQKPPPRGRLASDELGDPDATGDKPTATHAPAAGQAEPKPGEAPPPPSETAANQKQDEPVRPKPPEDQQRSDAPKEQNQAPQQLAAAGAVAPPPVPNAPDSEIAIRPERKPSPVQLMPVPPGGARRPTERPNEPSHGEGHKAKYPGPDATQDEYLAYIRDLTNIQLSALPPGPFEGRKGSATFNVRIRPNGSIVWFALVSSSGDDRADRLLSGALNEIDKFPPLPQELLDPKGEPVPLTLTLPLAIIPKLARSR
ncbi:MAG TPA: TonB C-terminal domain-containing protein, partial [Stellaceae bacterium]|nr:TonB C-terminal domain-containing protein [Stellaceae bacterium]